MLPGRKGSVWAGGCCVPGETGCVPGETGCVPGETGCAWEGRDVPGREMVVCLSIDFGIFGDKP